MSTTSETETTVPIPAADLSENDRHRLLADERRRVVLDILAERGESLTLTDLVTEVEAREKGSASSETGISDDIQISLHHMHLPMIADLGVIDYEPGTNRIDPR